MKIYVQKQIKTLYTPTNKKQSIQFNIIKQNEDKINHIHGQTVDNKGQMLKIRLKKYKIADFKAHIKNNSFFKLNSAEIYKIYDESKIKAKKEDKKKKSVKSKKIVDKKKESTKHKKPVDTKQVDKKIKSKKSVDKKSKSLKPVVQKKVSKK